MSERLEWGPLESVMNELESVGAWPLPASQSTPSDQDAESDNICWGALLKADATRCTPSFVIGKAHVRHGIPTRAP